jgi:hypothetical protein
MEAVLTNGDRVNVRWRYDTRDKQVRVPDSLINEQKKAIYALAIPLEQKRELCAAIITEESVQQELTSCIISNSETQEQLSVVTVTRWFRDPDNKPLARKTTFELAINGFSKADKRLIWAEFLKSVRLPKRVAEKEKKVYVLEIK